MGRRRTATKKGAKTSNEEAIGQDSKEAGQDEGGPSTPLVGTVGVDYTVGDYLRQRGFRCREKEGSFVISCPACKAKRCLSINSDFGTFSCSGCTRSGSFRELRLLFGDSAVVSTSAHIGYQFEVMVPDYTPVPCYRDYGAALHQRQR